MRTMVVADLFLIFMVTMVGWAVAGCLIGWERWLDVPVKIIHWSWHEDADWEARLAFGGLVIVMLILMVIRLALSGNEAALDTASLDGAGLISRCTFWWVVPTLKRCQANGQLDLHDLPTLPRDDLPQALYDRFTAVWSCYGSRRQRWRKWRLFVVVMYSIQRPVCMQSLLTGWLFLTAMFLDPILLGALLKVRLRALCDRLLQLHVATVFAPSTAITSSTLSSIAHRTGRPFIAHA